MTACLSTNGPSVCEAGARPTRLLVATLNGVDILTRADASSEWRKAGHSLDGKHVSALMRPPGKGVFASVHNGGIFHSADEGETWTARDNGVTSGHVFSLDYNGDTLYAGTEPVSLFRSDDNGANWRELPAIGKVPGNEKWTFPPPPHLAHTKAFLFDRRDPGLFFAAVEQGALLQTRDGGATWRELDDYYRPDDVWPKDIHRIARDLKNPDRLYIATGNGMFASDDGGEKWRQLTDMSFRIGYPDQMIVSPAGDGAIFASGAERDPRTWRDSHRARGTVLRSRDGGLSWEDADKGLPSDGRANVEAFNAAVHEGGFTLFAGNTDGEVYTSEDGADSWKLVANGLKPVSKGGHFRNLQTAA
jgi:photosystem II stability/assembly factor-like uncharacterized protein